jgi:plastocyanin
MAIQERSTQASEASKPQRRVAGLDWLILAGLIANFVSFCFSAVHFDALFISTGEIVPPTIITTVASLLLAFGIGATLAGWRWSYLVALVVTLLSLLGVANPFIFFTLTHPSSNYVPFATFATTFAGSALVIGAVIVKIIRMSRRIPNEVSRSMVGFTGLVAGALVGFLLLGFTVQGSSGAAVTLTPKNENVTVQGSTFAPDIVALHIGDTLTITDGDGIHHVLSNGAWSASNQAVPGLEPGAVTLNNLNVNAGSVKVGPFTKAGVYHIYCLVHPGMNLTVIVQ